ncbi:Hypothetical protein CINCED_3A015494 [Cinara cedri]|uniref:Uncharacterized protein n=1 Tax=Cinara cedri TaxID=506608 RepID=A0A5E4M4F7_9HEMI|nr:Hypothetical protein CINCED_3A015494 [Cinara cedri]
MIIFFVKNTNLRYRGLSCLNNRCVSSMYLINYDLIIDKQEADEDDSGDDESNDESDDDETEENDTDEDEDSRNFISKTKKFQNEENNEPDEEDPVADENPETFINVAKSDIYNVLVVPVVFLSKTK